MQLLIVGIKIPKYILGELEANAYAKELGKRELSVVAQVML